MTHKVITDKVIRLDGLLRINIIIENSAIFDARCSGDLFSALICEIKGRYPFDAVSYIERNLGICSTGYRLAPEDVEGIPRYHMYYFKIGRTIRSFSSCIACAIHIITSREGLEFQMI